MCDTGIAAAKYKAQADCLYGLPQTIIEVGLAHVEWKAGSGKPPKVKAEHLSELRLFCFRR